MRALSLLLACCTLLPVVAAQEEEAAGASPSEVRVRMKTSLGEMVFALDAARAPITTGNFLRYAQDGFYDGTVFHRVISTFMAQGGGLLPDGSRKETRAPIRNEADNGLKNTWGTIAMARTGEPHSATSQFFINLGANQALDHTGRNPRGWGYCVFGRLVEGNETLEALRDVPVELNPQVGNEKAWPVETVLIESVEILDAEQAEAVMRASAEAEKTAMAAEEAAQAQRMQRDEAQRDQGLAFIAAKGVDVAGQQASASGLTWIDVAEGSGASPAATDTVLVDYTLWMATDGRKIDASADHPNGGPFRTRLDQVIRGWTEGVTSMKVGGERWLLIPPHLGYGEGGHPAGIPGGATLVFHVQLKEIEAL